MLKRSLVLLYLVFSVLACRENHVEEIKHFRIYVATDETSLTYSIALLVRDYNRQIGFEALTVVDRKEDSTSLIHFRKGLINDGNKLGLGQWTSMQKQKAEGTFGQDQTTTIEYGMEIVFDFDNFLSKAAYIQDPESDQYKHLFHLFCHEVGHGMHMDHSKEITSVMYPSIPEINPRKVDYDAYFTTIRAFLQDPAAIAIASHEDEYLHQPEGEHSL